MRNIEHILKGYLSKSTQYAIQLTGKWGIGKTHYFRSTLAPLIESTDTFDNSSKKYKPIYISLFGLKTVDEIATKIVFDFFESKTFKGYLKKSKTKRNLKITQGILRIGIRGFLNFMNLGSVNDYLTDIKDLGQNVLDTSELLICFDDIERKHSDLSIEDLTGYINSLVDEDVKVLIISNEDLLLKNEQYANLKEKIIGVTIPFVPEALDTIRSIIETKYSGFIHYKEFLTENISLITNIAKSVDYNFRHLIYSLDTLHDVYSQLKNQLLDPNHEIAPILKKELPYIIRLTFAYSAEFKSSQLDQEKKNNYRSSALPLHEVFDNNDDNENIKGISPFLIKYGIEKAEYKFFESIFDFATSHSEFNIEMFITEFKVRYHLESGKIPDHYKVLNALNYSVCFDLSDTEYREQTLKMIDYAKEGKYILSDYLTVMHYAERLGNILGLNLENVKNDLITGFGQSLKEHAGKGSLQYDQFEMSGTETMSEWNKEIYKIGIDAIEEFKTIEESSTGHKYLNLLLENTNEFQRQFATDQQFRYLVQYYPIFKAANPQEIVTKLKERSNSELRYMKGVFKDRFVDKKMLNDEITNLREIKSLLESYKSELASQGDSKLRIYVLEELIQILSTGDQ